MCSSILELIAKTTPTSYYYKKHVQKSIDYNIWKTLSLSPHQFYKCNDLVKSHNLTRLSKPNIGSQIMSNFI